MPRRLKSLTYALALVGIALTAAAKTFHFFLTL